MWLFGGGIAVSSLRGAVSPDYRVYRFRDACHPGYMHHLLRAGAYLAQYKLYGRADTTFDRRVSKDDFHEMPILLPPIEEQRKIADCLDIQVALLARARALRQKQIDLLEEHFISALHDTLEDVIGPGGFLPVPLKYLCRIVDTEHKTAPEQSGGGYFVAGTGAIRNGVLVRTRLYETDRATYQEWTQRAAPRRDDLVLTREAPVGEVALLTAEDENVCIGQRVVLLRPNSELSPRLLLAVLLSPTARRFFADVTQGSLHPHLNMRDIGSIRIPTAPMDRQDALAETLIGRLSRLDESVRPLRISLDLLAERQAALITAAVTGQFDVTTARSVA